MLTAAAEMGVHSASSEVALGLPTPPAPVISPPPASVPSPSCAAAPPVESYAQQLLSSAGLDAPLAQVDTDNRRLEPTVSRTLNNVTVKAAEIDDLFQV
jgi:hypothetical protein